MVEGGKQVRVDNWGIFFLQRLQMFFSKTDYCDLTLQFEGNVQLKVHRLVMNACTDYFVTLEQTCPATEENTILMPADLQADVIVPIVNFMYTGMLEFQAAIFERLYRAADLMNITVLTKLLDAQGPLKTSTPNRSSKKNPLFNLAPKKQFVKAVSNPDLPVTLPGRKLPVWKRKTLPVGSAGAQSSSQSFSESKWSSDPLGSDNTPKPTRFEWPDDDLPSMSLMDTSFEDISYNSKPLLTMKEEVRAGTSFDEVRNNVNANGKKAAPKSPSVSIDMKDVEDYVKEQKIRSDITLEEEELLEYGQKRKSDSLSKSSPKRLKINDKENKEATISVKSTNGGELDHTKILSEILKKYPHLAKNNKNIRLKIKTLPEQKLSIGKNQQIKVQNRVSFFQMEVPKAKQQQHAAKTEEKSPTGNEEGPWSCPRCSDSDQPQEFALYYLYRKHMTDIHNEVFDVRLCKYCGRMCGRIDLMMYHLYTKHSMKPPASYSFPKCDRCPHIALNAGRLRGHRERHDDREMQCTDCGLAFTSQHTLTAHVQITGHPSRGDRRSYDCQYCTKKLQTDVVLFSHIKNAHMKEARRDGIVSLDELDDADEAEVKVEEYAASDAAQDAAVQKDKVKIISNVKVSGNHGTLRSAQAQTLSLERSSEAEALNNVASGIATSLGLVDIVVLDDNQQYILQKQENQAGETEYILPDLAGGENPFAGQVISTQHNSVIPQGMLQSTGSDIGSTDELVMVLTDHDYQDDQDGSTENSNIVVLYSHPVDGQQEQYITTSQGNLLVNAQTGMLEIRNGATISTNSSNQLVVDTSDAPIESIEMIQREIEEHGNADKSRYYEETDKTVVETQTESQMIEYVEEEQQQENAIETEDRNITIVETSDTLEISAQNENAEENEGESREITENEKNEEIEENVEEVVEKSAGKDVVDNVESETFDEPMEVDEVVESDAQKTAASEETRVAEDPVEEEPTQPEENPPRESSSDHQKDMPSIDESSTETTEENPADTPETETQHKEQVLTDQTEDQASNTVEAFNQTCLDKPVSVAGEENEETVVDEPMEVDGKTEETVEENEENVEKNPETIEENVEVSGGNVKNIEDNVETGERNVETVEGNCETIEGIAKTIEGNGETVGEQEIVEMDGNEEVEEDISSLAVEVENPEELVVSDFQQQPLSDTSNSLFNEEEVEEEDENSHSSHGTVRSQETKAQPNIDRAILEDWEDTDSQQSEKQQAAMIAAAENVNKLMDDWEEEEEEDKKDG